MLEVELYNFFLFAYMNLSRSYDLGCGFNMLTRVDLGNFVAYFFLLIISRFHPSTLT
jgi:hypothetical protein